MRFNKRRNCPRRAVFEAVKDGDVVSLDIGLFFKGFHSDMAKTVVMGEGVKVARKLVGVAERTLDIGIENIKIGGHFGDPGFYMQKYAESNGFGVVRDLCGHGIGTNLHEEPQILNYGRKGTGPEIKEGMVFCIEPMITAGGWRIKKSADGFGYKTADGSLSAHFEHTIALTRGGLRVLTKL